MQNKRFARDFGRAHLQQPRPPMADPVQRFHRLPLLSAYRQGCGHRVEGVLPGLQPKHWHAGPCQQLPDPGTLTIGYEQGGCWSCLGSGREIFDIVIGKKGFGIYE